MFGSEILHNECSKEGSKKIIRENLFDCYKVKINLSVLVKSKETGIFCLLSSFTEHFSSLDHDIFSLTNTNKYIRDGKFLLKFDVHVLVN